MQAFLFSPNYTFNTVIFFENCKSNKINLMAAVLINHISLLEYFCEKNIASNILYSVYAMHQIYNSALMFSADLTQFENSVT